MPVAADGVLSGMQLTATIRLPDPDYLVIMLLAPPVVARLCLTGSHADRATGTVVVGPHYHPWERNKPAGQKLRERLESLDPSPPKFTSRDEAFAWFCERNGIESPGWAIDWPSDQGFL
jgi:hypothetical protein